MPVKDVLRAVMVRCQVGLGVAWGLLAWWEQRWGIVDSPDELEALIEWANEML